MTQQEYFNSIVNKVLTSIKCTLKNLKIEMVDHDKLKGKAKQAIGIAYVNDNLITIDEFFVSECYKYFELNDITSTWTLGSHDTLEYVICHEIAHFAELRHGKKHTELTNRLLSEVELPKKYYEYIRSKIS